MAGPGQTVAGILLDIGAVQINAEKPFILTSGRASPVYIDCRRIISFLSERREIIGLACDALKAAKALDGVDYIAGGETAGIPYAAWLSESLSRPMLYVRKKPKGFGRNAQIEGLMKEGARVLFVEDLTTDGGSKIVFVNALREAGAVVTDVFSVFYYGIYPQSGKILADAGLKLHYLATWHDVLETARARKTLPAASLDSVAEFLKAPEEWSLKNGGAPVAVAAQG